MVTDTTPTTGTKGNKGDLETDMATRAVAMVTLYGWCKVSEQILVGRG